MASLLLSQEDIHYGLYFLLALFPVWSLSIVTYRLLFHPLKDFPGPSIAAASTLYRAYFQVYKDGAQVQQFTALHLKYGMSSSLVPW